MIACSRRTLPVATSPGDIRDGGRQRAYATSCEDLVIRANQHQAFRHELASLLVPAERHTTLTALAHAEPIFGAQHPEMQRLHGFLAESTWEVTGVTMRRLQRPRANPEIAPHAQGVLIAADAQAFFTAAGFARQRPELRTVL